VLAQAGLSDEELRAQAGLTDEELRAVAEDARRDGAFGFKWLPD
jgi:hypothetical protein